MKNSVCVFVIAGLQLASSPVFAEIVDLEVVHKIKQEAFYHSRIMDYMSLIADENGPRMSGSPGYRRAADKAVAAFKEAGIEHAGLEVWGTFGHGWEWSRVAVQMKQPHETTLTAIPADFSPATGQAVTGQVVFAPIWEIQSDAPENYDLEKRAVQIERWKDKYRGKLRGKIVMIDHPRQFILPEEPYKYRLSDNAIAELEQSDYNGPVDPAPVPVLEWPLTAYPVDKDKASRIWEVMPLEFAIDRWALAERIGGRVSAFLTEEGVIAVLPGTWTAVAGIIMHSDYGSTNNAIPLPPPSVVLMPEHYNRIHRLLERQIFVELEVDVDASFYPNAEGINVIAEIPGSARSPEVVMLGAHFDSWHGSTGATDNAAGSAIVMEAMRILRSIDLPMRRTVRAALWDGEEQALLGSRAYVASHFGDPVTMQLKPEHKKLSAYFNLDGGGGKIRGAYLQQNDMARPIFDAWLAPFADLGVTNVAIINTYGSDHLAFDAVGLPVFNFVQDPLDYYLNTHHSNVDDVSHIIPGDLMQAAAVMAASVYHAATREEMMPRKQLPPALPEKNELPEILR
jgi:carboxypeptidase Q